MFFGENFYVLNKNELCYIVEFDKIKVWNLVVVINFGCCWRDIYLYEYVMSILNGYVNIIVVVLIILGKLN